ncbi:MAG: spore maturation protein [Candidatus Sumerlaeaceae bacterium]|nr:spore maturation protein [Candidatus Sumerlaeaceae bacterium]
MITVYSNLINSWIIPFVFLFIVLYAYVKKVKVYEVFVEGAKEGFNVAVMVIPYLVVILAAIAIFRVSGAMELIARGINLLIPESIFPSDMVLLTLVKPLSGSAARGIMVDVFQRLGPDSFPGYLASAIQGSTETTFYVVAVYFGSIGVSRTRHTIPVGLTAELVAVIVSTIMAHILFRPIG